MGLTAPPSRDLALFGELLKRDLTGRYRGSVGGLAWAFVQPLFLLCVYTLAFGLIVGARWRPGGDVYEYGMFIFVGLIIYNAFSECIVRAPTLITSQPNLVKKVVFPLYVMPVVAACTALMHAAIGFVVWLAVYAVIFGSPKVSALWLPVILLSCLPALLGITWILAAVGTFFKDLQQVAVLMSHALLFLTPVFYGLEHVPAGIRPVLLANPLTALIQSARGALLSDGDGALPGLLVHAGVSTLFAAFALLAFNWMRPRFADVV